MLLKILDPDRDSDCYQNLITLTDWFLGHAPLIQTFYQNPFITFFRYLTHTHTQTHTQTDTQTTAKWTFLMPSKQSS